MDAIDNLIYTRQNLCVYPNQFQSEPITSDFEDEFPMPTAIPDFQASSGTLSYSAVTREAFVSHNDANLLSDTIKKHWFDIANRISYTTLMGQVDLDGKTFPMFDGKPGIAVEQAYVKFNIPPYHLIFSYLVENTRIAQIFEKLITMHIQDEKLTKPGDKNAVNWLFNTESLFFSNSRPNERRALNSQLRSVSEAVRRNAYQRMFGMDLAFGDINNNTPAFAKSEFTNSSFIALFENFLIEFWRGFTNANNTSGQNTTDTEHLEELTRRLQELLMSRRTTELDFKNYRYFNLSAEEYSSYIFMYWLYNIIAYDSPVVRYLNCNANTAGQRLMNIGRKVDLPAHTKSIAILDIAQPMNLILRSIEVGLINDATILQRIMRSQAINPGFTPAAEDISILTNLLLVINNWEKATGHRIKNPEANITGAVSVRSNGVSSNGVKAIPAMN